MRSGHKGTSDFLYPCRLIKGHLRGFTFLHTTESHVTESAFPNQKSARSVRTVRNLRAKKGKENFCLLRQKINYIKSDCVTRTVYICV